MATLLWVGLTRTELSHDRKPAKGKHYKIKAIALVQREADGTPVPPQIARLQAQKIVQPAKSLPARARSARDTGMGQN